MCFSSVQRSVNVEASTGVGQPGSVEGMQSTAESEAGQSKEEEEEGVAGGRGCDQSLGSPELGILAADRQDRANYVPLLYGSILQQLSHDNGMLKVRNSTSK